MNHGVDDYVPNCLATAAYEFRRALKNGDIGNAYYWATSHASWRKIILARGPVIGA